MSEQRYARLVRCPNCKNLLSELPDYSVFKCGTCGIVLRVKDKNFEVDGVSGDFLLGDDGSINDVRSYGSSASMTRRMEISGERQVYSSMGRGDRRSFEYEGGMDENVAGSRKEFGGSRYGVGLGYGSHRSDRRFDQRSGERGENEYFRGTQRGDVGRVRYSSSMHSYEGPSELGRNYEYVDSAQFVKSRSDFAEFKKVDHVEQEKAEILRKLNELKDQLSRIDVSSKPKEKVPTDRTVFHQDPYSNAETWSSDGSGGQKRTSVQYSGADKYVAGPSYASHYNEPLSNMDSREMAARKFYPTMQIQEFEDPSKSPVLRGPPYGVPPPSQQQYPHPYYSAQYMNSDITTLNTIKPYSHNINMHTPSCSCLQCYNKHPQVLPTVTSSAYGDRRYLDAPNNPMSYPRDRPSALGPQDYDPRFVNLPQKNYGNLQWFKDQNLGVGVSDQQRYPMVVPSSGGRRCYPFAGGAPLFACCSCFELLRLPEKFVYTKKSQKKIRCAACSKLIYVEVADKKLILSLYEEAKEPPAMDDDSSYTAKKSTSNFVANSRNMDVSSDEYVSSTSDIHLADRKQVSASPERFLSSNQSAGVKSGHSTSSFTSEDEDNKNTLNSTNKKSNSAELLTEAIPPRPPPGSPLKDHIDYSTRYTLADQSEKESKNDLSEQEMGMPVKVISRKNSGKYSAAATELDISSNEYFNTGTSIESGDISREEDRTRAKKGGPFFPDIIRESSQDRSSDSFEDEITNVTVNGYAIPNRLVKKAEKFAGLIQPGEYWYDSRAGFWGVMGGPCLGIIPPSIEEFNFPMPETCAGGDTGVYVNGRELHQKDLKLLGKRGLPTDTDRSYIIEISGRVLDEESGEELDSLGKLAPTVEKTKHGFGMRTPRAAR